MNERLETGVPGVYALGDVKGGPAFTHISYDDFRILRTNLLEGGSASTVDRVVPYVVFMDPQLGRVGLSESEARQRGLEIRVAKMPMDWVARALEVGESRGLMKVVVDASTRSDPGLRRAGDRGRGDRRAHPDRHDGRCEGGRAPRGRLRPSHTRGVAEQPVRQLGGVGG